MQKLFKVKLNADNTASPEQQVDGYLKYDMFENPALYTRGEAIKKARMFGGEIEEFREVRDQKQDDTIRTLLGVLCKLQDAVEVDLGHDDVQYANDLHSAVKALYFNDTPDGDMEEEMFEDMTTGKEEPMLYLEAYLSLVIRIKNICESLLPDTSICTRY